MLDLPYRMIDADGHYYEADDCCSRYIDPKFRDDAIHPEPTDEPGVSQWTFRGVPNRPYAINEADKTTVPGAFEEAFAGKEPLPQEDGPMMSPKKDAPWMVQREPRLKLLDEQGVEAQIMAPTMICNIGNVIGRKPSDIPALRANFSAFNLWLEDEWGFGADRRHFAAPIVDLCDPDWAAEEALRVAARGSKFLYMKTGPVMGKSPADPIFDRFWATVEETGMRVLFHISVSDFNTIYSAQWSEDPDPHMFDMGGLHMYYTLTHRPILDTMAAVVLHNLFGRFPGLQFVITEWGSDWVKPLMKLTDKAAMFGKCGKWLGGPLQDKPSDIIRNHMSVAPYYEDDFREAIDLLGVDKVLFGSDYPHPEGLGEPASMLRFLKDLSDDEVRMIMRDNAAKMLDLEPAPVPA